ADVIGLPNAGNRILKRGLRCPLVVGEVVSQRAAEVVASGLCDRVDDATGEPPVLGGDAAGQKSCLLNGILNDCGLGLPSYCVIHHDAVDEVEVVERLRTVNYDLVVRSVVVDARREEDSRLDVAAHRQALDGGRIKAGRNLRSLEYGSGTRRDGDRLRNAAELQVGVRAA